MARGVLPEQRKKVLTYGLIGAVFFRIAAISIASTLIQYPWIKFAGGGYLLYLVVKYFFLDDKAPENTVPKMRGFWQTVLLVELTDIAFAVDSILAAVALTKEFWLIVIGGVLGTIAIRFAATGFITLLDKFPRLSVAYHDRRHRRQGHPRGFSSAGCELSLGHGTLFLDPVGL